MSPSFTKRNKIFLYLTGILLAIVLLLEISKSFFIERQKQQWIDNLNEKITRITNTTRNVFNSKQDSLIQALSLIKSKMLGSEITQTGLMQFVNENLPSNISVKITSANGNDFVWTSNYYLENFNPDSIAFPSGESRFIASDLVVFLAVYDTINKSNSAYRILLLLPVEKQYKLQNRYFKNVNFTEYLTNLFNTRFEIKYSNSATANKDGRFHSFDLRNNAGRKIGIVSFKKPTLDVYLAKVKNGLTFIEYLLVILLFSVIGVLLRKNGYFKIHSVTNLLIFVIYLLCFRVLLFASGISEYVFPSDFSNPAYFASRFAFNMVQSPAELFVTNIFVVLIIINFLRFVLGRDSVLKERIVKYPLTVRVLVFLAAVFIFLLVYRAFGATIKSVMFDSTIIYFNEYIISPGPVKVFMLINILLIGFSFLMISVILLMFAKYAFPGLGGKPISFWFILFLILQIAGFLFDYFQKEPQATGFIRIVYITTVLLLMYLAVRYHGKQILYWVFGLFAGSVLSVMLMLHFNDYLEKDSIRIYAKELIKPNESWLRFLITETLLSDFSRSETVKALSSGHANFDASAFKIWSKSPLQKETINSSISILNYEKELLGGFGVVSEDIALNNWKEKPEGINDIQIFKKELGNNEGLFLKGIFPIKDNYSLLGYLESSILFDITNFAFNNLPEFLTPPPMRQKLIVGLDKIRILEFINDTLKNVVGNIKLSDSEVSAIKSEGLNKEKDVWFGLKINDRDYLFYSTSIKQEGKVKTLMLGIKKKNISRYLFDFFTVIFIHSILILIFAGLGLVYRFIRREKIEISLRAKLLAAFLVISIIPLILLAIYFRELTEEKNRESIFYKLGKRAYRIESYVKARPAQQFPDLFEVFDQAANDLNINYTVFDPKYMVFSTENLFYHIGLIPAVINPKAYLNIIEHGSQDYITKEQIENYGHNAFYYFTELRGKEYIIKVSDAFNTILLPMSGNEVDAFLIVNYSLAVLLVLLLSTILANQISKPIRKLTLATKSVAGGDLNIELEENVKGEVKGLVDGFNYMVRELKKNQVLLAEAEREAAWKEMAKQVAHEIKNPLTPMKLATQQLIAAYNDKSEKFDEIFKKVTKTIISQIETLGNIASEFSRFARMPAVKVEDVNLIELIDDAINLFSEEKVKIEFIKSEEQLNVAVDSDQLKRTLINVIRNSIQAGADKVDVSLKKNNGIYEIRIADNGSGIDEKVIDKIFDMNFTTKQQGTGIGLSLAKKFLESIGGAIEVEKTDTSGTTILIKLKRKPE